MVQEGSYGELGGTAHQLDSLIFICYSSGMGFLRIKTIRKNGRTYRYLYYQHNVRIGKKVKSLMRFIGAVGSEVIRGPEHKPPAGYFREAKETPAQKMQREFMEKTQEAPKETEGELKEKPPEGG